MVQVTVTAALKVDGGPTLPLSSVLEPQSYTFASVVLDAAGGAHPERTVDLLPDGGTVVVLGVAARTAAGKAAPVTLTATHGNKSGTAFELGGTLLVAASGVLAAMVDGGPRSLKLKNGGAAAVTVDVLTGLDA
jgi:hypothetical protein